MSFRNRSASFARVAGMCLPGERQLLGHRGELFSPGLLGDFRKRKLIRLNDQVSVVDQQYDVDTIERYAKTWYPGNYREDIVEDEDLPSFFKGFNVPLAASRTTMKACFAWIRTRNTPRHSKGLLPCP